MNDDHDVDRKISRLLRGVDADVPLGLDDRIRRAAGNLGQRHGQSFGARHRALLTCLGIILFVAAASFFFVIFRHRHSPSISTIEAFRRTLDLVLVPSQEPSSSSGGAAGIRNENEDHSLGRALFLIVRGSSTAASHRSKTGASRVSPVLMPDEISKLLLRDRVIEKALAFIRSENKEV